VELAVVQLKEGMQNPPLHRFEAVLKVRNSPVLDNIGSVFQEISIEQVFYVCHYNSSITPRS
jgi:hypothetical protein